MGGLIEEERFIIHAKYQNCENSVRKGTIHRHDIKNID